MNLPQRRDVPSANVGRFDTESPNVSVSLYAGDIVIRQAEKTVTGAGSIGFDWLPKPRVTFVFSASDNSSFLVHQIELGDCTLELVKAGKSLPATIYRICENISGIISECYDGTDAAVSDISFGLPNFCDYHGDPVQNEKGAAWTGRLLLNSSDWSIEIDKSVDFRKRSEELRACGGYAITHHGVACRRENLIGRDDARKLQASLFWFLSFCRGLWTGPVLTTGRDSSQSPVWTHYSSTKICAWSSVHYWTKHGRSEDFSKCFSGFMALREAETWKDVITLAVHWFVEANMCAGGIEGSIVLSQAALETISWHLLVEELAVCSDSGFHGLPAEDKLRLLLSYCRIPAQIPASLVDLIAAAKSCNWVDGPMAITQIRNALVHGQPKKLRVELGRSDDVRADAWTMGLWYIELVILSLCKYPGKYFNRTKQSEFSTSSVETVPWAQHG